jgi:hypothetical protein
MGHKSHGCVGHWFESKGEMVNIFEPLNYVRPPTSQTLKVVTSEKIGGSGVTSTLGTWYGGVVTGVLLSLRPPSCIEISTVRHHKSKI